MKHSKRLALFTTTLCWIGTLSVIIGLLQYSKYGIDFTDEGFYLVWISNPFNYDASVFLFGFIYHPLYSLLGGDIVGLRQANVLITFGLAWGLTYAFMVSLAPDVKANRFALIAISAGLSTTVFALFDFGLVTPSYNSLALQALLITATGLVLAKKNTNRTSIIGWILIGVGGWLAFMAKPSTALALTAAASMYLVVSRKLSIRLFLIALICFFVLLLISAMLIDGSVVRFVARIQLGMEFSKQLGGGHTLSKILRMDEFQLNERAKISLLIVSAVVFIATCCAWARHTYVYIAGFFISIAFFVITEVLSLGQIHQTAGWGQFQGLLIFGLVYASILAGLVGEGGKMGVSIPLSHWSVAVFFLVMPYIYAFGTNNNYWQTGSAAAIFWLLVGLVFLGPLIRARSSWLLALPLAFAAQAVTATLLQTGFENPYRQPQPLRLNASTLEMGPQKSVLVLSEGYAEYITSAVSGAQGAGFKRATPVIDLSGQSPGILYALGAENVGQAWIIGGYPGSLKLAESALARSSCEKISDSWVLFEPDGPRSISTDLMSRLGASFPSGYALVGAWQTAEGAGGYVARRTQKLYKPIKQHETLIKCHALRG